MRRSHKVAAVATAAAATIALILFSLAEPPPPTATVASSEATAPAAPRGPEDAPAPPSDAGRAAAAPEVATIQAAGPPESYTRYLSGVTGRIVDTDLTPVAGMRVDAMAVNVQDLLATGLSSLFGEEPPAFDEIKGSTETDADGRFLFEGWEPRGVYVLSIDPGGPRSTVRFVDDAPNPGQVVDLGDIVLDPYVVFFGRVVDEARSPVSGARIRATNLPSILFNFGIQDLRPGFSVGFQEDLQSGWRVAPIPRWITRLIDRFPVPTTRSADDGTFRLEGVPIGMVTVLVDRDGLVPLVHGPVPSGAGGDRNLGDLVLARGETLTGVVLDQDDLPIPGAEILAGPQLDLAPAAVLVPGGETDEQGRFAIAGLRDVEHAVAARKRGGAEWHVVTDVVPGFDDVEIRIGGTHQLLVTVFDAEGEVVLRPELALQKKDRLPLHPLLSPPIDLSRRIERQQDGSVLIRDLDPARYQVLAREDGYAVGRAEADLRDGSSRVEIVLEPEIVSAVTVVAKGDQSPVHYASVSVFPAEGSREEKRIPLYTLRTDEAGTCELSGLLPGRYNLAVFHPGFAEAFESFEVPGVPVLVELLAGGSISGVVRSGRQVPAEQRFVSVMPRGRPNFPRFSVTDPETGEFLVTHLEPGEYTVVVLRRFANRGLGDMISGIERYAPERFVEAEVREGEVTRLEIDLDDTGVEGDKARLRGRITLNGRPGEGMSLEHRPEGSWRGRKTAVADEFGRFDFGEVLAGKATVRVLNPGQFGRFQFGRLVTEEIELSKDEVRELDIEIRTGSLSGRVVADRDGAPLAMANVRITSEADDEFTGGTRQDTATDKDGSFEFDMVPGGTYRLRVRRDDYAESVIEGVFVPESGRAAPVEVRMVTGETVAGTVVPPPLDEQPRFLFVEFRSVDRDSRDGARVSPDTFRFEVRGLLPGEYDVRLRGRGVDVEPVRVRVPSGGLSALELVFRPKSDGA